MVRRSTSPTSQRRQRNVAVDGDRSATIVWTEEIENENWLKVPKVLLRLGRYSSLMGNQLQPRHVLLVLALAARKFKDSPITCSWDELGRDLGVKRDTVRHWAYEMRSHGLLRINNPKGWVDQKQKKQRLANTFEIDGFVELVVRAFEQRREQRTNQQ